jgi:hypothetical protein
MYKLRLKEAQAEAEQLLNYCLNKYCLNKIIIKIKQINGGRAIYSSRFISIPLWAYDRGLNYFYYYVLHEISHFICHDKLNHHGHDDIFKGIEKTVLADFNLIPTYKRAYIKGLSNNQGQELYKE